METQRIALDRSEARILYEKYQASLHYGEAIDREVARAYRLIGQGKLIIKAVESVKAAGLDEAGLPKLALLGADATSCWLEMWTDGSARFASYEGWRPPRGHRKSFVSFREGTFPARQNHVSNRKAIVPMVPIHLRPKHALSNYHVLWEADWHEVPRDPYLLRHLGKGDLWLVVAMWDLTEVERAALQARA